MSDTIGSLDVSRETFERLEHYEMLLKKWNPKINLVSKATLDEIWDRHIVDSAQIFKMAPQDAQNWCDLGSGGGFPGMVIAILSRELAPDRKVTLIESDQRKCAFLRTVARETGCRVTVKVDRIEKIAPLNADILSARALADLSSLLGFAQIHLSDGGTCLFPKGASWEKEIEVAQDSWRFEYEAITSETSEDAVILRMNEIKHA